MSRILCVSCQRPQKGCICAFTVNVANELHVVVLQHPSEVSQTKGTITLLAKSLSSCQVIVGEYFSEDECFLHVLEHYQPILLYPGEHARVLSNGGLSQLSSLTQDDEARSEKVSSSKVKPICLVVLDGTWKKAYRMYMLSTYLQQLPQICLPDYLANSGQYHIRKVARKNALSSLEASCYALALLEEGSDTFDINPDNAGKYQPLLDKFKQFNQFQLSFRPDY
jgi:DTW domain-containing protein YfiP